MFLKHVTAGLAGSVLLATVAFAQTATTDGANMTPARMSDSSLRGDWRTSKVVGLSVYNDNDQSIGSINDLLTDKSGNIKAVVLGVGGFLGVGAHLVAVPFDKVKFVMRRLLIPAWLARQTARGTAARHQRRSPRALPLERVRALRPGQPRRRRPIRGTRTMPCSTPPRMNSRQCLNSNIRRNRPITTGLFAQTKARPVWPGALRSMTSLTSAPIG